MKCPNCKSEDGKGADGVMIVSCDTEPKQKNRILIRDFIERKFDARRRANARVLCLPGGHGREIFEIYDKIGIKRKNIVAISYEDQDYENLTKVRGIKAYKFDITNCSIELASEITDNGRSPFDIIYLDIYGTCDNHYLSSYNYLLKNNGIFGITCSLRRERKSLIKSWSRMGLHKVLLLADSIVAKGIFNGYNNHGLSEEYICPSFYEKKLIYIQKNEPYRVLCAEKPSGEYKRFINCKYPTSWLLTKYVSSKSDGNTPMGTAIIRFRSVANLNQFNYYKIISNKIEELCNSEIVFIDGKADSNKNVINCNNGDKYFISKSKKEKKQSAIEWLRMFPDKNDLQQISEITGFSIGQLKAFKAHIKMGTYN